MNELKQRKERRRRPADPIRLDVMTAAAALWNQPAQPSVETASPARRRVGNRGLTSAASAAVAGGTGSRSLVPPLPASVSLCPLSSEGKEWA